MDITPLNNRPQASDIPLERLAGNPNLTEAEKTAEVSRQFEALLVRQILQESSKTVFKSTLIKESAANGIYQDMINNQIADGISKSGSLGLAQSFKSQLVRQTQEASSASTDSVANPTTLTSK